MVEGKRLSVMLAPNEEVALEKIKFPIFGSYKLDGVRALVYNGEIFSRSWKLLSAATHKKFRQICQYSYKNGIVFDCELFSEELEFNGIISSIKGSAVSIPESLKLYCFDVLTKNEWDNSASRMYYQRIKDYWDIIESNCFPYVEPVPQYKLESIEDLIKIRDDAFASGNEGLILRSAESRYKHGRSTLKSGEMYKIKQVATTEGQILDFDRATKMKSEYREDKSDKDEMGYSKRTSSKETREEYDAIGSVVVRLRDNVICNLMFAKDCTLRTEITWENRHSFIGKWVEFKYLPTGTLFKPRFGRIIRLRSDLE